MTHITKLIAEIINTKPKNSIIIHIKKIDGIEEYITDSIYRTIEEMIYCIQHNIQEIPLCEYDDCNEYKKFDNIKKYSSGCSTSHSKKITSLKKYGVDNPAKSSEIKSKIKNIINDNHGGMHHMQTTKYKEKFSELSKKSAKIRTEKSKATCKQKYGCDSYSKTDTYKKKIKETNKEKYGYEHNFQSNTLSREKRKKTMIQKYGVEYALQNEIIKRNTTQKFKNTHINNRINIIASHDIKPLFDISSYDGNKMYYLWECQQCNHKFEFKIEDGKIPYCSKCNPRSRSNLENKVLIVFDETDSVITNYRQIKYEGRIIEYDFFVNNKLLIEVNGNYWHSELNGKDSKYHLTKTNASNDLGLQTLHFFEDEIYYKFDIVKSIINAKLGKFQTRIYARQCELREIDSKTKNQFLEENHIQGQDKSTVKLGLFYNDELVSVMTFGHSRYNKKYQWEMHRFCNKLGYQIVGGASKLFKNFVRKYTPQSIITYADRRYSDGTFYEKIGFNRFGITPPNFFVLGKNKLDRQSRIIWQKHKLEEKLDKFDTVLTAWENMQLNGYDRIWDCGNYKFEWIAK